MPDGSALHVLTDLGPATRAVAGIARAIGLASLMIGAAGPFTSANSQAEHSWHSSVGGARGTIAPAIGLRNEAYMVSGRTLFVVSATGEWVASATQGSADRLDLPVVGTDGTIYLVEHGIAETVELEPVHLCAWSWDGAGNVAVDWCTRLEVPNQPRSRSFTSRPAIGVGGRILVPSASDSTVYCVGPNGQIRWTFSSEGRPSAISIGPDGTAYVSTTDMVHALSVDGNLKWTYDFGRPSVVQSPAIGDDGTIYLSGVETLWAMSAAGELKWAAKLDQSFLHSQAVIDANGRILVSGGPLPGTQAGSLYSISPGGELEWVYSAEGLGQWLSVGDGDEIYVAGAELISVHALLGVELWRAPTPSLSQVMRPDGVLVVAALDGGLSAIDVGARGPAASSWPMTFGGSRHTSSIARESTAIENVTGVLPHGDELLANYPNPFNETTTLRFNVGEPTRVRLDVINLIGQVQDVIVDRPMERGSYQIQWSARGLASSIYIVRLTLADGRRWNRAISLAK